MDKFIVGSKAFFSCYEDFVPHDDDKLILVDDPQDFKNYQQIRLKGNCIFKWRRMSSDEFVKLHKDADCGILIGKFLVPEFSKEIGMSIEQLKELSQLVSKLDERHEYEKIIYDSYIENNDFVLTDEQRLKAYNKYKKRN